MFLFCLVFAMPLCASVFMCFVVTCWERADLLALVCGVYCEFLSLSHWYPGSGVVLDCIDSWSLHPYLLFLECTGIKVCLITSILVKPSSSRTLLVQTPQLTFVSRNRIPDISLHDHSVFIHETVFSCWENFQVFEFISIHNNTQFG